MGWERKMWKGGKEEDDIGVKTSCAQRNDACRNECIIL